MTDPAGDLGTEAPTADALEQQRAAAPGDEEDEAAASPRLDVSLEADPADVAEQRCVVPLDEDDDR